MKNNIINNSTAAEITKNDDTLFFPITLNRKNALNKNVRYIKIVVLPSEFQPSMSINKDNLPINVNSSLATVVNDNIIDKNEVGSETSYDFTKKVLSKNIVTNLLQKDFEKKEVFVNKNDFEDLQEFIISIPRSNINSNLKSQRSITGRSPRTGETNQVIKDYELPHYFIVYALDSEENILEYKKVLPSTYSKEIDDYPDVDFETLSEAFIDEVGGDLDINWQNFRYDKETNKITGGPHIRLNYDKFLKFVSDKKSLSSSPNVNNLDVTLEYSNSLYSESFFTKIILVPLEGDNGVYNVSNVLSSVSALKKSFLNVFAKIDIKDNDEVEGALDISDYFENKFIVNLYRTFKDLNLEETTVSITIALSEDAYTKDVLVSKENLYNFYKKYLEFNKEKIIKKTFENKLLAENVLNDLNDTVCKLTVSKFDYKSYSLNTINDTSFFDVRTENFNVIKQLFFDDNCTVNNSINAFQDNKFYVKSLFESENTENFYFKNNSSIDDLIKIFIDGYKAYEGLLTQNISSSQSNLQENELSNFADRVEGRDLPNNLLLRGRIDKPIGIHIEESLLQSPIPNIQRNYLSAINASLSGGDVNFSLDLSLLNTDLIKDNLISDLDNNTISIENKSLRIKNNSLLSFKIFSNNNKFLGTLVRRSTDALAGNMSGENQISVFRNSQTSNYSVGRVEMKIFLLKDRIIDNLATKVSDEVKEELCKYLVSLKPSRYHYIVRKIDNSWFKENSDINVVINEIGELLDSSNLENTKVLENIKNLSTRNRPSITSTKIKKIRPVSSRKTNIKNIKNVKSSKTIDHLFDFTLNDFNESTIDVNLVFDIKENFIVKRKSKSKDFLYSVDLKQNKVFNDIIKSKQFKALNVYSYYGFQYYNKNITSKKENITGLNITSNGCIIDDRYLEIISNFSCEIGKEKILVNRKKNKALNYNERYYNLVKTVWGDEEDLKIKSIFNRVLFEVILNNGDKTYYGSSFNLPYNKKYNSTKAASNNNLSISLDDKLQNPNIILMFGK